MNKRGLTTMLPEIHQQKHKTKKCNKISSDTTTSSINIIDDAGTHILSTPLSNSVSATFADTTPPSIHHKQTTRPIAVLDKKSSGDISSTKLVIFLPFLRGRSSSSRTTEIGTKKEYATSMARLRPRPAFHVEENNNGNQEFHHVSHNPAGPISFIDRAGGDCHQRQDQINLERPVTVKLHDSRETSTTSSCSRQRSLWTPSVFSAFERTTSSLLMKGETVTAPNDET
eukprot:scaffold4826_cov274-Chaetoceros_neogracile.AAC.26